MNFQDLIDSLNHETNFSIRRYIPDKLAKLGNWKSTKYLGKILCDSSENPLLRNECAESLGKQGDLKAIPYLTAVLSDPDAELRRTVVWSLGQIGSPTVIQVLFNLTVDSSHDVKRWIAKSFGRINDPDICSVLIELYKKFQQEDPLIVADVIRAMNSQLVNSSPENQKEMMEISLDILKSNTNKILTQSVIILIKSLVSLGIRIEIKTLNLLLKSFPNETQITPHVIEIAGFHKIFMEFDDTKYPISVVKSYRNGEETTRLEKLLDKHSSLPSNLIATIIECNAELHHSIEIENFLALDNLNIKLAIAKYYLLLNKDQSFLDKMFMDGKGINTLITYLQYVPFENTERIKQFLIYGTKSQRQAALSIFNKPIFQIENFPMIKETLIEMSKNDRIWHIRRDARRVLQELHGKFDSHLHSL